MARLGVAIALLLLTGCRLPGAAEECKAQIDWVDFIQVGPTQYVVGPGSPATLNETDLGPVVAQVKFKVSGNVCDPGYRPKDGDAAFLEPGTPIYQVTGKPARTALAARHDGQIWEYEARSP